MHVEDDVAAVELDLLVARRAQGDMQHGAVFPSMLMLLAAPHRTDACAQSALFGQLHELAQRFVGEPVLRIVQIKTGSLHAQPLAALRIVGEKRAQMHFVQLPNDAPRAPAMPATA